MYLYTCIGAPIGMRAKLVLLWLSGWNVCFGVRGLVGDSIFGGDIESLVQTTHKLLIHTINLVTTHVIIKELSSLNTGKGG